MRNDNKVERYVLLEDNLVFEENTYLTYGIAVAESDKTHGEEYHNISTDRDAVFSLVKRCNELLLDPVHLKDVVEDFLISV